MNGDAYASSRGGGRTGDRGDRPPRDHHASRRDDRRGDRDRGDRDRGDRRRRSRSPGHRSSRREYEVDSYSSSRDYREREREDRYRDRGDRGDRREEREWDRSGPRRERHDTDRPPRRDRGDLFDDRRGGGGGGGGGGGKRGDRDAFGGGGRDRKRSASPPPKKKEPTPDLTDTVSVLERRRRLTQWDIKPPGYENVTAEQAKLSGMFPLPGAPRQQTMDPSKLQALMNQPANAAANTALKTSHARQSKRLFVYNIPPQTTDQAIQEFFNLHLNGLNVVSGIDACTAANISKDRSFALVEFRAPEDATIALAMDGLEMEEHAAVANGNGSGNGASKGFSTKRPKDYIVPTADENPEDQQQPSGVVSTVVKDSPNKISITNIPVYLNDEQVQELLVAFGELKAYTLVKDTGTDASKGIAFCEYADPSTTGIAVESLNGMELGDQNLRAQRASIGTTQVAGLEMGVSAMSMFAGTESSDLEQGRVIQLLNMVTPEELMDSAEYEEICEDVREECEKYGKILDMKIPRPSGGSRQSPGVGKIFVKYEDVDGAQKALKSLAGRKFADRTVVVTFFGEEYFDVDAW